jgi:signal transduction histidine kinase
LTIIRGYNEAMLDGAVTDAPTVEKYRRLIREESERLERLIHDLLDLSRLQSGNSRELEPIPLADLAEAVAAKFRGQAVAKGITLQVETDTVMIAGNGDRLTQLIVILMDNALKFTPAGGSARLVVQKISTGAQLIISDSGMGIPPEDIPYIWERFYKVNKAHSRTEGGTGLGLAIAKEIIELHRGNVAVSSRPNEGTVFTVSFPALDRACETVVNR